MLDHWPLIGREDEFREVNRLLAHDAVRGVVLAGKPGVGKSRLARDAARSAGEAGWVVRSAAATTTSRAVPLGVFAQWAAGSEDSPSALARRISEVLTSEAQPGRLLLLVDDVHLLDDLSALVVHHLVYSGAAKVIATVRAGQTAPAAVSALWKDGLVARRDVEPLTRDEVGRFVAAAFAAPPDRHCLDQLWRLTHGNVLYLQQLCHHEFSAGRLAARDGAVCWQAGAAISESLAELVDAQIGAIPDDVRDVVDLVAVANPIDWDSLRLNASQDAIEAAEQRELVRTSGDEVHIGHPMYAEVRLLRCGPTRLRRLRGQIAQAMKDNDVAARTLKRGLLWLESDLPPEPDVLMAAATAATSLLDFETAERLYSSAAGAGAGAQAHVPLALSLLMRQRGERAMEVLDELEADSVDQSTLVNDVVMRASNLLWSSQSPEASRQVIDDALVTAEGPRRHQLLVFRANQLALAARPADVLDATAQVDYDQLDPYGTTMGLSAETMAFGELGQTDAAVAKADQSTQVIASTDQVTLIHLPLAEYHTFALAAAGRIGAAVDVANRHVRIQQSGPPGARMVATAILGMAELAAGDLTAALTHLPARLDGDGAAESLHAASSFHRFHLLRAQALARTGDALAAESALETALAHRHRAYVYIRPTELLTEAWLAAARQRLTEARRLARTAAEIALEQGQFAREVWCLQTAAHFDDVDVVDRLAELVSMVEGPRAATVLRYATALGADDGDELVAVSEAFETMGDLLAAADAAGQAATSHRRAGRVGSAMTAASRSHRLAADCGGATSPAIAAALFTLPFTNREREVAALVARGMSNRDIAEAVSLSVRTVESHVYRACTKAGVTGRSGLAEVMRGGRAESSSPDWSFAALD
ncbi:LuxR family transcriptional regulator [Mycolicibacterium sp. F2034L]|uniref:helix-turn-helix transcriptional regulator n=1 Tax=Mycolicibacterium sp. F2034L TaxID=2926422 RepID=UPI001FF518A5|nr:LuxR family transcriptional regulator [Mycolicibacterium sp. F2034L]MCK0175498.1 LuxR C-terminal-related transcriptional regulator [Mycolicibacterium sp. F2034L]